MRWKRLAMAGVLVSVAIAACSPDVVPMSGRSASQESNSRTVASVGASPPGNAAPSANGAPQTNGVGTGTNGLCGRDDSPDAARSMLSASDVWPRASGRGQGFANYQLDPAACQARLAAHPIPQLTDCNLGFPYYTDERTELARIGVLGYHIGEMVNVNADGTASSTVLEVMLDLGSAAAHNVAALALSCGAHGAHGDLVTISNGVLTMLLRVGTTHAVALNFDSSTGLSNAQKTKLLNRAMVLADG